MNISKFTSIQSGEQVEARFIYTVRPNDQKILPVHSQDRDGSYWRESDLRRKEKCCGVPIGWCLLHLAIKQGLDGPKPSLSQRRFCPVANQIPGGMKKTQMTSFVAEGGGIGYLSKPWTPRTVKFPNPINFEQMMPSVPSNQTLLESDTGALNFQPNQVLRAELLEFLIIRYDVKPMYYIETCLVSITSWYAKVKIW